MDPRSPLTSENVRHARMNLRIIMQTLMTFDKSRFLSLAFTSLEVGAMWLGDVLAVLGEKSPYKSGELIPIADFPKPGETWEFLQEDLQDSQKIEILRRALGTYQELFLYWLCVPMHTFLPQEVKVLSETTDMESQMKYAMTLTRNSVAVGQAYEKVREARLSLGMEYHDCLKGESLLPAAKDKPVE